MCLTGKIRLAGYDGTAFASAVYYRRSQQDIVREAQRQLASVDKNTIASLALTIYKAGSGRWRLPPGSRMSLLQFSGLFVVWLLCTLLLPR